jgi:RimJ/RimL family protein N-acetyltransferase
MVNHDIDHRAPDALCVYRGRLVFFLALRQSPDIMRFMGAIACEDDIRTLFISRLNDNHARVIRDKNGEPLGDIGLNISTQHPQEADIGYAIAPFAQGKGCQ